MILGTFFGVLPDFGVSFLDCSRIFGYNFLVKFINLGIIQIFEY